MLLMLDLLMLILVNGYSGNSRRGQTLAYLIVPLMLELLIMMVNGKNTEGAVYNATAAANDGRNVNFEKLQDSGEEERKGKERLSWWRRLINRLLVTRKGRGQAVAKKNENRLEYL